MKVGLSDERRKDMPMKVDLGDLHPTPGSSFSTNASDLHPTPSSSFSTNASVENGLDFSFMEEEVDGACYQGPWSRQARWHESQIPWPSCHEDLWGMSGGPQSAWYPHGQFVGAAAQLLASGAQPGCWAPRAQGAARSRQARPQASATAASEARAAFRAAKEKATAEKESVVRPEEATTIMMRNLPNKYTKCLLLEIMADEGFAGLYDLVYLPVDFNTKVGLGYAFVNLISPVHAKRFAEHFEGFSDWTGVVGSQKVCRVSWSDAVQGVEAHVERYRNSPVMHSSVPDEYKPQLFKDGQPIPFPAPTGRVKAPRARRSGYLPS